MRCLLLRWKWPVLKQSKQVDSVELADSLARSSIIGNSSIRVFPEPVCDTNNASGRSSCIASASASYHQTVILVSLCAYAVARMDRQWKEGARVGTHTPPAFGSERICPSLLEHRTVLDTAVHETAAVALCSAVVLPWCWHLQPSSEPEVAGPGPRASWLRSLRLVAVALALLGQFDGTDISQRRD